MAKVVLDDWLSLFHVMWGIITAISGPLWFIPLVMFWIYESHEQERRTDTLGDWIEYFTGWLGALQWFQWFHRK